MRDPYLYEDVDVLRNRANIKDYELLRKAEADITNLAMTAIYEREYAKFNTETLCDIHRTIFGQIYDWGGEFRTIQMTKSEVVLGGDTVHQVKINPNTPVRIYFFEFVSIKLHTAIR